MRYALILAGGSGTRLWPMSRAEQPKQLIPFIAGRSLIQLAAERLQGLIENSHIYICAAQQHQAAILAALPSLSREQYIGEPVGRDTVNAVGLSAGVIAKDDPEAVIAVFTADHLIHPVEEFQSVVGQGFATAESGSNVLVTFGIQPTSPATGFGYLQLGEDIGGGARVVKQFREKPDLATATSFFDAGPKCYLWNSGMFVWRASTLLDCIRRYQPETYTGLHKIAEAWGTHSRDAVLQEVYPTLRKISVDFAVMEPASRDPQVRVAAVPMNLEWLDVGSWPMFARTCPQDESGNSVGADRSLLVNSARTLVASSDPNHLIVAAGCEDLIIVHTPDATLVCHADHAESIKDLHARVGKEFGVELL